MLDRFHHVAVICSNYEVSKDFYTSVLGYYIVGEYWRADRQSWKCDLVSGETRIELFHFPNAPARPSRPEAQGLRHLAFAVTSVTAQAEELGKKGVVIEPIRIDPYTGAAFTFFADPDGLPIELYEVGDASLNFA